MSSHLPKRWVENKRKIERETKVLKMIVTGAIAVSLIWLYIASISDLGFFNYLLLSVALSLLLRASIAILRRKKSIKIVTQIENEAYCSK